LGGGKVGDEGGVHNRVGAVDGGAQRVETYTGVEHEHDDCNMAADTV
jgi:hypothetical protein